MLFPYGNAWPLLTFLKACGRWAHVFATNASPRPWTKLVMPPCPTPTVHGGQYDTKYQVCDNRVDLCKQHLWGREFPSFKLNHLVTLTHPEWSYMQIHRRIRRELNPSGELGELDRKCGASQPTPTHLNFKAEANQTRTQRVRQQRFRTYRYANMTKDQARTTGTLKARSKTRGSGVARRTKSEKS